MSHTAACQISSDPLNACNHHMVKKGARDAYALPETGVNLAADGCSIGKIMPVIV